MVAEVVDAVVGVDTHRDTHQAEIASPAGVPIATTQIPNTSAGFTALLAWIAEHSPGPRILLAIEGSRSYGIGLTRAAAAAGLAVIEVGRPARTQRRGVGKSDPIDAHLAVLTALRLDADRLAGDVALEGASDFAGGLAFGAAAGGVGAGAGAGPQSGECDGVDGPVEGAVAAAAEPVADGPSAAGRDWADAGE